MNRQGATTSATENRKIRTNSQNSTPDRHSPPSPQAIALVSLFFFGFSTSKKGGVYMWQVPTTIAIASKIHQ